MGARENDLRQAPVSSQKSQPAIDHFQICNAGQFGSADFVARGQPRLGHGSNKPTTAELIRRADFGYNNFCWWIS